MKVTLVDGTEKDLPVTWSEGDYDGDTAGVYKLEGTITLADGVMNLMDLDVYKIQGHSRVGIHLVYLDTAKAACLFFQSHLSGGRLAVQPCMHHTVSACLLYTSKENKLLPACERKRTSRRKQPKNK